MGAVSVTYSARAAGNNQGFRKARSNVGGEEQDFYETSLQSILRIAKLPVTTKDLRALDVVKRHLSQNDIAFLKWP